MTITISIVCVFAFAFLRLLHNNVALDNAVHGYDYDRLMLMGWVGARVGSQRLDVEEVEDVLTRAVAELQRDDCDMKRVLLTPTQT